MSDYAARIRAARAYAGLSRPKLAEKLGVSERTLGRREDGDGPPPKRGDLLAIAMVCGVPITFLEHGFGEVSSSELDERLDRIETALIGGGGGFKRLNLEPVREHVRDVITGLQSDVNARGVLAPSLQQERDPRKEEPSELPVRVSGKS